MSKYNFVFFYSFSFFPIKPEVYEDETKDLPRLKMYIQTKSKSWIFYKDVSQRRIYDCYNIQDGALFDNS